jgi:tetratricopeptide (TPR) repeat protein
MGIFSAIFGKKPQEAAFLSELSERERIAVGTMSPMVYRAIAMEKNGHTIELHGVDPNVLDCLRRLSPAELERLEKSAQSLRRADQFSSDDKMDAAAAAYREAFESNPYNDLAIMSYGCALANSGDVREGIKWVERSLALNPDNERAKRNLAGMRSLL